MRSVLLSILGFFLLSACGESGKYYEKSPDAVISAIESAVLPTVSDRSLVGSTVSKPDKNTIIVTAKDELGGDVFRIVTRLTPEGNGTRVETRFEQLHKRKGHDPAMSQKFAVEHVAAAVEGRPFDMMFATAPVAKAVALADPETAERVKNAGAAMTAFSKMEQDSHQDRKQRKFDEEYGDDWAASGDDDDAGWGDNAN
jgi:hypothetical protein